jgi:uncharacterized protein
MPVNADLIQIVVCPKCKGELHYDEKMDAFDCNACKLRYAVEDDIPNFLIDEATEIKDG